MAHAHAHTHNRTQALHYFMHVCLGNIVQGFTTVTSFPQEIIVLCTGNPRYGLVQSWLLAQNHRRFTKYNLQTIFQSLGTQSVLKIFLQLVTILSNSIRKIISVTLEQPQQRSLTANCCSLTTLTYSNSEQETVKVNSRRNKVLIKRYCHQKSHPVTRIVRSDVTVSNPYLYYIIYASVD